MKKKNYTYASAIKSGFEYLLKNYGDSFVIGQGLWSPWYVGSTMQNLEKNFSKERIIDSPVSESAVTAAAFGAAIAGKKAIVVHPRMDFMLYAADPIINQIAKWRSIMGINAKTNITIRAIINRGGEQGAQHSQALHGFFAHIPGLRIVMPGTVRDARNLLIDSVLCEDPVIYIDDRWLYEEVDEMPTYKFTKLKDQGPEIVKKGNDITLVTAGHTVKLAFEAAQILEREKISTEIIDLRIISPLNVSKIIKSVKKTKRLICIDGGWSQCGISAEILAKLSESEIILKLESPLKRITIPFKTAPTSYNLESDYYIKSKDIVEAVNNMLYDR
tara:strand:+ start:2109 stop:3101 length:993 start_codon:yes stop_codon:yes gene_type:complete